jgi:tyrosyl-tRNA synthetase
MKNVIEILRARGLIEAETVPSLSELVEKGRPIKVYCGFDPTADCLHLGHMMGIMGLSWFYKMGHSPIALVGGATGLIGDPSGKSQERNLLGTDDLAKNVTGIRSLLESILARIPHEEGSAPIQVVNNNDWLSPMSYIEFLRDVGRHFRVGTMLGKESVRARLTSDEGISYTEFSYQLLQSYDFYHLFKEHNVKLQIGGADQWGNITAGVDFVRRMTGEEVWGLTFPLLLRSDGKKFGKSENGAIWLSEDKLSCYDFYQYLFRIADQDVIRLMKALTFIDLEEINALEASMKRQDYVPNTVQKRLAEEVTRLVHGEEGVKKALSATRQVQPGVEGAVLTADAIRSLKGELRTVPCTEIDVVGKRICDVLASASVMPSKAEVRRLISNGGLSIGDRKIVDEFDTFVAGDFIEGVFALVSLGKKTKVILEIGE